jgi:O-antigen ligase
LKKNKFGLTPTHEVVITWAPTLILAVNIFFWTPGFDAFNFSKQAILLVGVGTLLFFYTLNFRRIQPTIIELSILVFVVLITVLTLMQHDFKERYWWGAFSRANGTLTNIAFLSLALILCSYFSSKLLSRIYIVALLSLIAQCIYGVVQLLGLDPIPWENPHSPVITFFGNPNFSAASYGVLAVAMVRFINFDVKGPINFLYRNWAITLLILLSLFLNYQTASIQGLATCVVGLYFFVGLRYLGKNKQQKYLHLLRAFYVVAPFFVVAGFAGRGPLGAVFRQETFLNRLEYWRIAWNILRDNFWFGVGADGYSQYYQLYRSLEYTAKYGTGLNSSAAHNVILQWGASYGIIGVVIYCVLIFFCVRNFILINNSIESTDKNLYQVTFTVWLTYQATALISIEQIGIAIWGWAFSGIILGWSNSILAKGDFSEAQFTQKHIRKTLSSGLDGLVFLIAVILALPATYFMRQDLALRRAVLLPGISAGIQGSDLEKRGETIVNAALPLSQDKDYFQFAVMSLFQEGPAMKGQEFAKLALREDSRNTQAIEALAIAASNLKVWSEVVEYRRLLAELDPQNYVNEARIGEALYNLGNKKEALAVLKSATSKSMSDPVLETYRQLLVLIESETK